MSKIELKIDCDELREIAAQCRARDYHGNCDCSDIGYCELQKLCYVAQKYDLAALKSIDRVVAKT